MLNMRTSNFHAMVDILPKTYWSISAVIGRHSLDIRCRKFLSETERVVRRRAIMLKYQPEPLGNCGYIQYVCVSQKMTICIFQMFQVHLSN